jgi:hypothetical protein
LTPKLDAEFSSGALQDKTTTAAAHRERTLKVIGDNVLHFLQQSGRNNVLITKCDHETPPQQTQS